MPQETDKIRVVIYHKRHEACFITEPLFADILDLPKSINDMYGINCEILYYNDGLKLAFAVNRGEDNAI